MIGERALAIVRVRSPLIGSVRYSLEASACEQSQAFALLNRPRLKLIKFVRRKMLLDNYILRTLIKCPIIQNFQEIYQK
jgi:hypothetical protein